MSRFSALTGSNSGKMMMPTVWTINANKCLCLTGFVVTGFDLQDLQDPILILTTRLYLIKTIKDNDSEQLVAWALWNQKTANTAEMNVHTYDVELAHLARGEQQFDRNCTGLWRKDNVDRMTDNFNALCH